MASKLERQLLELAQDALRATEEGRVEWRCTTREPREYYAHFPTGDDLAVSENPGTRLERSRAEADFNIEHAKEYLMELVSPESGVVASLDSARYDPASDEYATLRALFEAARADAEGYDERIERLRRVLQEQT